MDNRPNLDWLIDRVLFNAKFFEALEVLQYFKVEKREPHQVDVSSCNGDLFLFRRHLGSCAAFLRGFEQRKTRRRVFRDRFVC
jgi:hypothetical protein